MTPRTHRPPQRRRQGRPRTPQGQCSGTHCCYSARTTAAAWRWGLQRRRRRSAPGETGLVTERGWGQMAETVRTEDKSHSHCQTTTKQASTRKNNSTTRTRGLLPGQGFDQHTPGRFIHHHLAPLPPVQLLIGGRFEVGVHAKHVPIDLHTRCRTHRKHSIHLQTHTVFSIHSILSIHRARKHHARVDSGARARAESESRHPHSSADGTTTHASPLRSSSTGPTAG